MNLHYFEDKKSNHFLLAGFSGPASRLLDIPPSHSVPLSRGGGLQGKYFIALPSAMVLNPKITWGFAI